jgi:predicted acylesterase/phospholipase RssA
MSTDLILSSGFLAFARQIGVLRALERAEVQVDGICGTSSGALVGSMWAAGHDSFVLEEYFSAQTPLSMLRVHLPIWRGIFSLHAVVDRLRQWLPPRFEDLKHPFGVGVMGMDGRASILRSGPLPEAVAASCAIPFLFAPIVVDGVSYRDGGAVDRTGLAGWRTFRGQRPTILHLVDRTGGARPVPGAIPMDVDVVRTRRSGAQFWSLGDVKSQVAEAEQRALEVLRARDSR